MIAEEDVDRNRTGHESSCIEYLWVVWQAQGNEEVSLGCKKDAVKESC
jgi:hypothetical protein